MNLLEQEELIEKLKVQDESRNAFFIVRYLFEILVLQNQQYKYANYMINS